MSCEPCACRGMLMVTPWGAVEATAPLGPGCSSPVLAWRSISSTSMELALDRLDDRGRLVGYLSPGCWITLTAPCWRAKEASKLPWIF